MMRKPTRFKVGAPLPAFCAVEDAIAEALPFLTPHKRALVSEIAEMRMIEAGGHWVQFKNDVAPYMVEPQNMVTSRKFDSICFVGPARSSKSEGLVINPLVHAIIAQPRTVAIFNMTQGAAREFSVEKLSQTIRESPELRKRLGRNTGDDNIFEKRFTTGARLTLDWIVPDKLAARSIPLVIFTDFDAMPQDVAGEGSPFILGRKRTQSAMSRGMTIVESSPRFPILDDAWTPSTPHEAPPTEGILAIYNGGTRGRWYWRCFDCRHEFEPTFRRLDFPKEGLPADRGERARMICPECGSVFEPRHKAEFNARGRWLHETADGAIVPVGEGERNAKTASYWLQGPAAALASWSQIVTRFLEGIADFKARGDEKGIRAAENVEIGIPSTPRSQINAARLSAPGLRKAAIETGWKVAPKGTRFITVAVDVQPTRFVVQVEAWRAGLERTVIDRFDIHTPPESSPGAGDRTIAPALYPEDWDALTPLIDRAYPVDGGEYALKPLGVIVDCGGEAGVTPNAYDFYRKRRRSHPRRFHIVRGDGGLDKERVKVKAPETSHRGGRKGAAKGVLIIWAGTDRLKDEISASLLREHGGPRALRLPKLAPGEIFEEYAAERRTPSGWEKKPGVMRNEALDLSVYALALVIALGAERIKEDALPAWARPDRQNTFAVLLPSDPPSPAEVAARLVNGLKAVSGAFAADPGPPPAPASNGFIIKRPKGRRM